MTTRTKTTTTTTSSSRCCRTFFFCYDDDDDKGQQRRRKRRRKQKSTTILRIWFILIVILVAAYSSIITLNINNNIQLHHHLYSYDDDDNNNSNNDNDDYDTPQIITITPTRNDEGDDNNNIIIVTNTTATATTTKAAKPSSSIFSSFGDNNVSTTILSPSSSAKKKTNIYDDNDNDSDNIIKYNIIPQIQQGWWTPYIESTSRIYKEVLVVDDNNYPWCILEEEQQQQSQQPLVDVPDGQPVNGLLYVKSHKASSSTCEAINNAIAHHVGQRKRKHQQHYLTNNNNDVKMNNNLNTTTTTPTTTTTTNYVCRHFDAHEFADRKQFARREKDVITKKPKPTTTTSRSSTSLLWTFVRHPQTRDVSEYFHFKVSREHIDPFETSKFYDTVMSLRGRQSRYLLPQRTKRLYASQVNTNPLRTAKTIKKIIQTYDFIGLTERYEDSLAVMTLLWNLHPTDVIVLKVKQSGGYDGQCIQIQKAFLTNDTKSILTSAEYINGHADFLLYYAAELSLNKTIDALGEKRVQDRVNEIHQLQLLAQQSCQHNFISVCNPITGEKQHSLAKSNCYTHDAGCGYPCVDQVMKEYITKSKSNTKNKQLEH